MSPTGDKKVNIGRIRAMFSQYGFSRNHWTTFEVDGDESTPITGHCLMGALGHAYEIGNSSVWQIDLDSIRSMPDTIMSEAVKEDLSDIARMAAIMTNEYRREHSGYDYDAIEDVENIYADGQAGVIMDFNDSVAGYRLAIPELHRHDVHWLPRKKDGNLQTKHQVVWLGPRTKKDGSADDWYRYTSEKDYAKRSEHLVMRYTTKDCTSDCAQMVQANDEASLEDIYELLDRVEAYQTRKATVTIMEPVAQGVL
tara:strand:+ start:124 stop:885 length:762 start_codon:yes stop_codon:yes gene_type:complete